MVWYVDSNKVSHMDPAVVDSQIKMIEKHFDKLTVTRGKSFNFLGIDFDVNNKKISMTMKKLLEEAIELFGEAVDGSVTNPANKDLFTTYNGTSKVLDERKVRFSQHRSKIIICNEESQTRYRTNYCISDDTRLQK